MILACRVSVRHVAGERFNFTPFILLISLLVFRLLQKPILCAYYNLVHYSLSNCILSSAFQCLLDIPLFSTQLPFFPNLSDSAPARHPSSLRGLHFGPIKRGLQCSESCGGGLQVRKVTCSGGNERCALSEQPASVRPCNKNPCPAEEEPSAPQPYDDTEGKRK